MFRQFQEDGLLVAENTGGPRFTGELFSYDLEVTLKQDPEKPESLVYGEKKFAWDGSGFFVDADGLFYVRDRGNVRVAVFDASGRFVRSIGRVGSGPGDFSESFELVAVDDGLIEVYDPGPRRFTRFRPDGIVHDIISTPIPGFRIRHDRDAGSFTDIRSTVQLGSELISSAVGFMTVNKDGEEIASASTKAVPERYAYPWDTRTGVAWTAVPFAVQPLGIHAPDGNVLLAQNNEPVLWLYATDGTEVKKITIDLPARPITPRDVAVHFDELAASLQDSDLREQARLERMRQSVWVPRQKAYWSSATVDDRDYVWLKVLESAEEQQEHGGGILYHMLSPKGEFLGLTRAPAEGRVMYGSFLGTSPASDSDQVEYAVWRITPQPTGFVYK